MHEPTTSDDGTTRERPIGTDLSRPTTERLAGVVVSEEDRPDRLTVYPADRSNEGARTVWLTATAEAFVDLDAWR